MPWHVNIQYWCGENSLAGDFVGKGRIRIVSINTKGDKNVYTF